MKVDCPIRVNRFFKWNLEASHVRTINATVPLRMNKVGASGAEAGASVKKPFSRDPNVGDDLCGNEKLIGRLLIERDLSCFVFTRKLPFWCSKVVRSSQKFWANKHLRIAMVHSALSLLQNKLLQRKILQQKGSLEIPSNLVFQWGWERLCRGRCYLRPRSFMVRKWWILTTSV